VGYDCFAVLETNLREGPTATHSGGGVASTSVQLTHSAGELFRTTYSYAHSQVSADSSANDFGGMASALAEREYMKTCVQLDTARMRRKMRTLLVRVSRQHRLTSRADNRYSLRDMSRLFELARVDVDSGRVVSSATFVYFAANVVN